MGQDPSAIRADIERERRELGETVAALAEKADVKGQAQRKISETRETLDRKKDHVVAKGVTKGRHVAGMDGTEGADKRRTIALAVAAGVVLILLARRR
jgi:predicted TIM-barrel fold metal-dependent hydrolase